MRFSFYVFRVFLREKTLIDSIKRYGLVVKCLQIANDSQNRPFLTNFRGYGKIKVQVIIYILVGLIGMKKLLLMAVIVIGFVSQINAMDHVVGLRRNNVKTTERLPMIDVFQEFNVDGREFLPEFVDDGKPSSKFLSTKLYLRCSDLNEDKFVSDSVKDTELLNFAKNMASYENEWRTWHTTDNGRKKLFLETQLNTGRVDKNGQAIFITVRRDENSPYFKNATTNDSKVGVYNIFENQAYHDELKFLQTQLCKMDLYWNIKPKSEQELQQADFNTTRNLVEQEIVLLKKNRIQFAHSCMKSEDFENLQGARNAYAENVWNDLPWYKKIFNYGNRSRLNQDIRIFKNLQQKHQLTKNLKLQQRQQQFRRE